MADDATQGETYAGAGVSIDAGEEAVDRIKSHVRSTFRPEVIGDIGGFGGLFALDLALDAVDAVAVGDVHKDCPVEVADLDANHEAIGLAVCRVSDRVCVVVASSTTAS